MRPVWCGNRSLAARYANKTELARFARRITIFEVGTGETLKAIQVPHVKRKDVEIHH
jgi:hypothetical protein